MENDPQPEATPFQPGTAPAPRSYTLAAMMTIAVLLFIALHFLNQAFASRHRRIAREEYAAGVRALEAGQAADAAERFLTALRFSPGNRDYELDLAQALAAAGRLRQAESYLHTLLQEEPGDGMANLQLARLALREHDLARATRYFHAAIYGAWPQEGQKRRLETRIELVRALLQEQQLTAARSELIGLTGDLPDEPGRLAEAGALFLAAGDNQNAFAMLRRALEKQKAPPGDWLRDAGLATFRMGNYPVATEYLRRAVERGADGNSAAALAIARAAVALDPYARGVRHSDHVLRAYRAWGIAGQRMEQCSVAPESEPGKQWAELRPRVSRAALARDPELLDAVTEAVFRLEQATESCPSPTPEDSALALLAQRYAGQGR